MRITSNSMILRIGLCLVPFAIIHLTLLKYHVVNRSSRALKENGGASPEPSHIQMCRAMINRSGSPVTIHEDPAVCHNEDSPYASLLQIFSSVLLADVSSRNNLDVSYSHNCGVRRSAVQDLLPPSPSIEPTEREMSLDVAINLCQSCLEQFDQDETSSPDCLLFSRSSEPTEEVTDEPMGIETVLPSIKRSLMHASNYWFNGKQPDWELNKNYALIYLDCSRKEGLCTEEDSPGDYRHIYAQEIPRHVERIDIIADVPFNQRYAYYGNNLRDWVKNFYPTAKEVNYIVLKTTASMYARMMKARYVVCPPGLSCLLPALTTPHFASIIKDNHLYPWIDSLPLAPNVNLLDPSFKQSHCMHIRGRHGKWVQDLDLAHLLQYQSPIGYHLGDADRYFEPTSDQLFRSSTTYKWEEHSFPQCKVDILTPEKFCNVLKTLGITRVFMLGDSLTREQAESLWKLFEQNHDPGELEINHNWEHIMQCPNDNFNFLLSLTRNDLLSDKLAGKCKGQCFPWINRYMEYPGKTLFVANTGAHIVEVPKFKEVFDEFLSEMDSLNRPTDIVLFRTSVPGHEDCAYSKNPHPHYVSYLQTVKGKKSEYGWELFTDYNDYMAQVLAERKRNRVESNFELLDVYPMTVLRQDGHHGGEEFVTKENDCLHYNLPGPIDWWNHLLYSNLVSMVDDLKSDH